MNRYWEKIIFPILKKIDARHIVEIGSGKGKTTKKILKYCFESEAKLSVIDPAPKANIDKLKKKYDIHLEFYEDISLNALQSIKNYDVVLIDGDHNWYTAYNELKIIEDVFKEQEFLILFLHDIGWPYGRRDMYYNPENIPDQFQHFYKKKGMLPGQESLLDNSGFNAGFNNAIYENNGKNGVLTAVEDFIEGTELELTFKKIEAFHGLGILYLQDKDLSLFIDKIIEDSSLTAISEKDRIVAKIKNEELKEQCIDELNED
jgi:SAM-dependent methyltransferase